MYVRAHFSAVLRIKIGDGEVSSIPCSSPNAMNQNSGWIKCIHSGIDPDEACFQHYLVHSLVPDSTLMTILNSVYNRSQSKNILGLVLVNLSDSTVLLDAFWDTDLPSNFLLCIVSHKDGQPFLDWLQKWGPGEVSMTVGVESSVDVPGATVMERSSAKTAEADRSESAPVCIQHTCAVCICVLACMCGSCSFWIMHSCLIWKCIHNALLYNVVL